MITSHTFSETSVLGSNVENTNSSHVDLILEWTQKHLDLRVGGGGVLRDRRIPSCLVRRWLGSGQINPFLEAKPFHTGLMDLLCDGVHI